MGSALVWVQEAMRKYPAGGVASFRSPVKGAGDVVLGGGKVVIPQGAVIHTPIAAIQLSPDLWDEPERFNPDRWLQVCMRGNTLNTEQRSCACPKVQQRLLHFQTIALTQSAKNTSSPEPS